MDHGNPRQVYQAIAQAAEEYAAGTTVLQIGAADGRTMDPVYPLYQQFPDWRFVRVEPRIDQFDALAVLHLADQNVTVHQACVVSEPPVLTLYEFRNLRQLPPYAGTVASQHIRIMRNLAGFWRGNGWPQAEIGAVDVLTTPFDRLVGELGVDRLDILVTDTAGEDADIVQAALTYSPKVICYESFHISETSLDVMTTTLQQAGYTCTYRKADHVWVRNPAVASGGR